MKKKVIKLTPKASVVLEFLKWQEEPLTGASIAQATGQTKPGVQGVLGSLVNKGFAEKRDKIIMNVINKKGLKEEREYVTYIVTDEGKKFEIVD